MWILAFFASFEHVGTEMCVACAFGVGFGCSVALLTIATAVKSLVSPMLTFFGFIVRFSSVVASFESCRAHVMQAFEGGGYREEGQKSKK